MARVGILGGTFNPPHVGHLVCAQEAHAQLGLDVVLLVPAGTPPHKALTGDPGGEVRLRLCEAAVAADGRFAVSRVELDRPGSSYTADTLSQLRDATPRDDLILIVGADMAHGMPGWHEPERVRALAGLAVAERAGVARAEVSERLAPLGGIGPVEFLEMPRIDVSSSMIRARVATGRPIRWLVPDGVARVIAEDGLYRAGVAA